MENNYWENEGRSHCSDCPLPIQVVCSQPPNERFICLRDQAHGSKIDVNRPSTWEKGEP